MLTAEKFWQQVGAYNQATLLIQILMIVAGVVLLFLSATKPGSKTNLLIKIFFSFAFAWNGIVFFLIYAKNPISNFIGTPLFIILSLLFALDIFTKKTNFSLPDKKKCFTFLWLILVFLYPLIGYLLGHYYPKTCMPMMPCPLTIFAIALITASAPNIDKKILLLLLPWALISFPKCLGALDCYEDCILFGAGIYGLIVLVKNWDRMGKT
jgi:hypothetical protein